MADGEISYQIAAVQDEQVAGVSDREELFEDILRNVGPEDLASLYKRLQEDQTYFALCSDTTIAAYFRRWDVPITSRADVVLFSQAVNQQLGLAAREEPAVKTLVREIDYHKQLHDLPTAMQRLHQEIKSLDEFKPAWNAVLRYVWEAVQHDGFSMAEDGRKASVPYPGNLTIEPCSLYQAVYFQLTGTGYNPIFSCFLEPVFAVEETKIAKKRLWGKGHRFITQQTETGSLQYLWLYPYCKYDEIGYIGGTYRNAASVFLYSDCKSLKKKMKRQKLDTPFDEMVARVAKNQDANLASFKETLTIILSLPQIMHNYTVRQAQDLKTAREGLKMELLQN